MRPAKVYLVDGVTINSPEYRELARAFTEDGAFLGSDKDENGLYIIIDLDITEIVKEVK